MQRCHIHIGEVNGYLCHTILLYKPAYGFYTFQQARFPYGFTLIVFCYFTIGIFFLPALFPYIKCHSISPAGRCGIQVHIIGNEEIARTYHSSTTLLIEYCRAVIRFPLRLQYLGSKTFILPTPYVRKVPPVVGRCRILIQVYRYMQLLTHPFTQHLGKLHCFFSGDT